MDDLTEKCYVCIVLVSQGMGTYLFGVYESEELARKRVEELSYTMPTGSTIHFKNEIVWKETEAKIREFYNIALQVPAYVTLGRLWEMLDKLSDFDIEVDYDSIELQDNGLFIEATYPQETEDIEEKIKAVANGDMSIDWDTMSDWEVEE